MARHRNVRSMNYAEEYDGYDDVYGHSVEDDYSISPSDAAYVFDRNTQKAQMSAFLTGDEDIAEEDEDAVDATECTKRRDSDTLGLRTRNLSELDEARLRSCLDEIRNVIGDSITEASLADIILANDFDVAKSLNSALSNASDESKKPPFKIKKQETPLPRREPRIHSAIDADSTAMHSLKEGVHSIKLNEGAGSPKFGSVPFIPSFKIPKLSRPHSESDKENVEVDPKGLSGNLRNLSQGGIISGKFVAPSKALPGLGTLNIPSLTQKPNKVPPLFRKVPLAGSDDSGADTDEECSSLSALLAQHAAKKVSSDDDALPLASNPNTVPPLFRKMSETGNEDQSADSEEECLSLSALLARHASKTSGSEHSTLSSLSGFHLKSNNKDLENQPKAEFVIPSLKLQAKPGPVPQSSSSSYQPDYLDQDCGSDVEMNNDGFVIDLLGALNPPDIRKQLERPESRNEGGMGHNDSAEGHEDSKPWIQDRTCVLDARPVLFINFPMALKLSSPVGRILCRKRFVRTVPYVRPSSPFIGDIVPFGFDTPSPDALVRKHLRRL